MTTFIALYRGIDLSDAQLIAVSTDAAIVIAVAQQILVTSSQSQHKDPILDVLQQRRNDALRLLCTTISKTVEASNEE